METLGKLTICSATGALLWPLLSIPIGCCTFPIYTTFSMAMGAFLGACCYSGIPEEMKQQYGERLDAAARQRHPDPPSYYPARPNGFVPPNPVRYPIDGQWSKW